MSPAGAKAIDCPASSMVAALVKPAGGLLKYPRMSSCSPRASYGTNINGSANSMVWPLTSVPMAWNISGLPSGLASQNGLRMASAWSGVSGWIRADLVVIAIRASGSSRPSFANAGASWV